MRASSLSVFARALAIPVSSGLTTTTRCTCGSRIRATSQQLAVTSNATRSVGNRLCASTPSPSGVLGTRPAERTFPSSQIATTQKSRCTSRPIARPTHLTNAITHLHDMVVDTERRENQREKRHRPIRAPTLNPGKSQGRPKDKHGLEAHRRKRPTRLRSPKKAPVPDHRTLGPDPDGPSRKHFHAATSASGYVSPHIAPSVPELPAAAQWAPGHRARTGATATNGAAGLETSGPRDHAAQSSREQACASRQRRPPSCLFWLDGARV